MTPSSAIDSSPLTLQEQWFEAARQGDLEVLQQLLSQGIDPLVCNDFGLNALMLATVCADTQSVRFLVDVAPDAALVHGGAAQDTALLLAVSGNDREKVQLLLPVSDPSATDHEGINALCALFLLHKDLSLFDLLLSVSDPRQTDIDGQDALSIAATKQAANCLSKLLPLCDVRRTDDNGWTPLLHAISTCTNNDATCVELLLQAMASSASSQPSPQQREDVSQLAEALERAMRSPPQWACIDCLLVYFQEHPELDLMSLATSPASLLSRLDEHQEPLLLPKWSAWKERAMLQTELSTLAPLPPESHGTFGTSAPPTSVAPVFGRTKRRL